MKKAKKIKRSLEQLRVEIVEAITDIVASQPDNRLELEDDRGSLVVGGDDQESIAIMSAELIFPPKHKEDPFKYPSYVAINFGVYDEDGQQPITDYGIETLVCVLEACEKARE